MPNRVIYIMGVSGSGKTTIGKLLSIETGYSFYDADDFHSQKNIEKMRTGEPLTDDDRLPWLESINLFASKKLVSNTIIIACSALKQVYREQLSNKIELHCIWIFLKGDYSTIIERMENRKNHFMPEALLQSQFETLELPQNAIGVNINMDPTSAIEFITKQLKYSI